MDSRASVSTTDGPEGAPTPEYVRALVEENQKLRSQLTRQQIGSEDHTARLASLYVAVNSVNSALDQRSVLESVRDIVNTLIGSEEMALFEIDRGRLTLRLSEGIDADRYQDVRLGEGAIGTAATTGELFIRPEGSGPASDDVPAVCIPLKLGERVVGVIAIFGLLPQKHQLDSSDRDLFDALTAHVARALMFARMYEAFAAGVSM